jgi:hypothetical protein
MGIDAVGLTGMWEYSDRIALDSRDLISAENPLRHDPEKLAAALIDIGSARVNARTLQRPAGERALITPLSGVNDEAAVRAGD